MNRLATIESSVVNDGKEDLKRLAVESFQIFFIHTGLNKTLLALFLCFSLGSAGMQAKAAEGPDEHVLGAIGGLTAAYVYQAYLNIGMIGDSVANKSMEPATGKELLRSVLAVMDTVDDQLAAVSKNTPLSAEDKKGLGDLQKIIPLLKIQGEELELIWSTKEASHAKKYEAARTLAWDKIKTTLGIKD